MNLVPENHRPDDPHRALHDRIIHGDTEALEHLTAMLLRTIPDSLRRSVTGVDREMVLEAVEDAILEYATRPSRFDPGRGAVLSYVRHIAFRNLQDKRRAQRRLDARIQKLSAQLPLASFPRVDSESERRLARIQRIVRATCTRRDQAAFHRWMARASGAAIAEALGFGDRPAVEQRKRINRFKERMIRRLRRHLLAQEEGHKASVGGKPGKKRVTARRMADLQRG